MGISTQLSCLSLHLFLDVYTWWRLSNKPAATMPPAHRQPLCRTTRPPLLTDPLLGPLGTQPPSCPRPLAALGSHVCQRHIHQPSLPGHEPELRTLVSGSPLPSLTYPSLAPSPLFDDMTTTPQLSLREQKPQQLKSGSPWTEPLPPGHTSSGLLWSKREKTSGRSLGVCHLERVLGFLVGEVGRARGQGRGTCRWVGSRPPTPTGAWIPRGLCKQLCKHPPEPRQLAEHSERTPFAGSPCPGTRSLSTLPLLLQRSQSGKVLQNSKLNSKHIEACPGPKAFKHNRKMLANHESGIWWVSGITEV